MKIAIYHNLEKGGALNQLIEIAKILKSNNVVDLYTHKNNIDKKIFNEKNIFSIKKTNNIFQHLFQIFIEKKKTDKIIAKKINEKKYDLILIFPCILTQSPYLLRFINCKKSICIYFFTEPKREFYERTSFDYFYPKKILVRILRYGIKHIDKQNCKKTKNIISNSYFSANKLKNIYKKDSFVVYPGLVNTHPIKKQLKNKNILSVGLHSYIKGHDFTIRQLKNKKFNLMGRKTEETHKIKSIARKNKTKINYIYTENDNQKNNYFSKYGIFINNARKEPFGITTLEATNSSCFIFGTNNGGTPEIVDTGINGYLYPHNIKIARKVLKKIKYN